MAKRARGAARAGGHPQAVDIFDRIALRHGRTRAEVIEEWSERAAIREYLGGHARTQAEVYAFDDVELMFRAR